MQVWKRVFLRHVMLKVIILPRQARDKHRESTPKKRCVLLLQRVGVHAHGTHGIVLTGASGGFIVDSEVYDVGCSGIRCAKTHSLSLSFFPELILIRKFLFVLSLSWLIVVVFLFKSFQQEPSMGFALKNGIFEMPLIYKNEHPAKTG